MADEPDNDAAETPAAEAPVGLHFMCLNANIQRQFEFVQNAWIVGNRFNSSWNPSERT